MHIQPVFVAAIFVIVSANPSLAKNKDADALFERTEPSQATMSLADEGELWRVTFRAGGIPDGAATAADCELEAVGPQDVNGIISAHVVPFDGDLHSVSAADIGVDRTVIEVSVGPEGAFVTDSGASARYCGLGSYIDGFYRRADSNY